MYEIEYKKIAREKLEAEEQADKKKRREELLWNATYWFLWFSMIGLGAWGFIIIINKYA